VEAWFDPVGGWTPCRGRRLVLVLAMAGGGTGGLRVAVAPGVPAGVDWFFAIARESATPGPGNQQA
jgi:hypothetical protein